LFKPVAFCLSTQDIDSQKFYSDEIKLHSVKTQNMNLAVWFIGTLPKSINRYLFSFPQTDSLLDRNVIISIYDAQIVIENDWLGSIPIFYNQRETIISTIPNLCLKNKTIDKSGIQNYFLFGYSVFEHTPFKDIKFLRYYSKLTVSKCKIQLVYKDDPILEKGILEAESTEAEAVNSINQYVELVENSTSGDIIIPTSGGYDSRILNMAIDDTNRIRSFTYGTSKNQSLSYEVIYAKKIAELLGTKWEQIELSNINDYIDDWHRLFGFSTHLHGMYHIEFYKKILSSYTSNSDITLLSGIFGDVWAGNVELNSINSEKDVLKLGYTHGLSLDNDYIINPSDNRIRNQYYEENIENLKSYQYQIVSTVRIKLVLISYLFKVPEYYGVPVWTPFLNFNVAIAMLRLPSESKKHRNWQRKFFIEKGFDIENMIMNVTKSNSLDYELAKGHEFSPIDERCFHDIINKNKVNVLNKKINSRNRILRMIESFLVSTRLIGIFRRLGIKKIGYLNHLGNYYILKAIEKSLL
jgi:hypothetical protein